MFMNPAAEELVGWPESEGVGAGCEEVIRILDARGVRWTEEHPLSRAIRTGGTERTAGQLFARRNGTAFPAGYTCAPFRRAGVVSGGVIVFRDITLEKKGEAEQRLLAQVSAALASSLDEGSSLMAMARLLVPDVADVCLVDERTEDGSVVRVASALADAIAPSIGERARAFAPKQGWRTPQAVALDEGRTVLIPNLTLDALIEIAHDEEHAAVLRDAGITSLIVVPLRLRGRSLGALTAAMAGSGRRFGPGDVSLVEEIGRRASMAMENAHLYRVATRAARAREEILAVVAHDLRNPLGAVMASVAVLERIVPASETRIRAMSGGIRRSAESMTRLIGDLLDMSSIDAGGLAIQRQEHDAAALVSEAVATMQGRAEAEGISLTAGPSRVAPLWCDRERILQAISNLERNAIAATPRGGAITVRALSGPRETVFTVTDTGRGIARDQIPRILEKRAAGPGRRGSLGLGLGIVQGIAKAHGGSLRVESVVGEGSTFSIVLPARGEGVS
jgi:PAS domain S-box-containing protein